MSISPSLNFWGWLDWNLNPTTWAKVMDHYGTAWNPYTSRRSYQRTAKNQRQPGLQSVSFSCSLGSQPLTRCTASNRHRLSMLFTRRDWSPNPCQVERLQNLRRNCWGPLSRSQVSASSFTSMALDFHANRFRQLGRDKVPVTEGLM